MIYHIAEKPIWTLAKAAGTYEPETLQVEGFIHCCTEQLFEQVANFYFKGRNDLVVLEIDESKLQSELKWETVGAHKFPHVYGPLEVEAVERVVELISNDDGVFEFPFKPVLH